MHVVPLTSVCHVWRIARPGSNKEVEYGMSINRALSRCLLSRTITHYFLTEFCLKCLVYFTSDLRSGFQLQLGFEKTKSISINIFSGVKTKIKMCFMNVYYYSTLFCPRTVLINRKQPLWCQQLCEYMSSSTPSCSHEESSVTLRF